MNFNFNLHASEQYCSLTYVMDYGKNINLFIHSFLTMTMLAKKCGKVLNNLVCFLNWYRVPLLCITISTKMFASILHAMD